MFGEIWWGLQIWYTFWFPIVLNKWAFGIIYFNVLQIENFYMQVISMGDRALTIYFKPDAIFHWIITLTRSVCVSKKSAGISYQFMALIVDIFKEFCAFIQDLLKLYKPKYYFPDWYKIGCITNNDTSKSSWKLHHVGMIRRKYFLV